MADDEDTNMRVAKAIKREMFEQRKNQRQLGRALGLSQPQVSERLTGLVPIRIDELKKIAEFLGKSASEFLESAS